MAIIQGNAKGGAAGAFYPKTIDQSLRFNDNDGAYLSRTPASAGNRKTWTWSGWVKRGNIKSGWTSLFASASGSQYTNLGIQGSGSDTVRIVQDNGSGGVYAINTAAKLRDASAWYHIVLKFDTTQATSSDRIKIYINGVEQAVTGSYPAQNLDAWVNNTQEHLLGGWGAVTEYHDGYLSEVHFVDGQALDATSFGEFKNGVWVPKNVSVTYGTNGFYLPFRNDYTVEGFSTVTYTGNGDTRYIGGVGFEPDLVWVKNRNGTDSHVLVDSVRGSQQNLFSNLTAAETTANRINSFSADGFEMDGAYDFDVNESGSTYVAWCWDAGTGSPASNTDGSITSTVKANPAYGFSIVSYTGTGSNATVGHGLSSAPDLVITKDRTGGANAYPFWTVYHSDIGATKYMVLNGTDAQATNSSAWNNTDPTSSLFSLGGGNSTNYNGNNFIAYCFHSVSGYSDFGSYTGTGASGNTVTTGFKPAFVMVKRIDSTSNWRTYDSTRMPVASDSAPYLHPNLSDAEATVNNGITEFTDTGFVVDGDRSDTNTSGGTYIYMAFADTREAAFWLDDSGNNNDWENNNLTESDIVLDSPTNNFATLNPLFNTSTLILKEGNLHTESSSGAGGSAGTFNISNGKWYFESCYIFGVSSYPEIGIINGDASFSDLGHTTNTGSVLYRPDGKIYTNNGGGFVVDQTVSTASTGDVIGVAFDLDNQECSFFVNNTQVGTTVDTSYMSADVIVRLGFGYHVAKLVANFGQDSSFAGNKTPQGNTDANGLGDFYYAPPAGYLALCTSNLPEPAIGPNSATTSDEHFNTVLYTNATTVTGVGFAPDLVWHKSRNQAYNHYLYDIVRGTGAKGLNSNSAAVEGATDGSGIVSFDSDGVTYSSDAGLSQTQGVGWFWKANGSGVSNSDGSITSTVSANTDAGFSIVSYTGNGIKGATVGHGLSSKPELVIFKRRDSATNWITYNFLTTGSQFILKLNATDSGSSAAESGDMEWYRTASTFTVEQYADTNGGSMLAYCFHSVDGFSKFGSYTGNGSADGSFIYCGFRPSFVMIKRTDSAGSWEIYDNNRIGYNVDNNTLFADLSNAESTADRIDILSNGFKLRSTAGDNNASGGTYIYMAFAEIPVKYSGSMAR